MNWRKQQLAVAAIRPADSTEVDHTQSFSKALHKGHIRIQAKCKQAPPATQHAFSSYKQLYC